MKRPLIPFIILTFLILLWPNSACTEPNEEKPIEPDTTSHEFEWRVDTIGTYGYLHDVAIIDDNNIWVVGEFYTPDPDSSFDNTGWEKHNAAQWANGKWNYHRLLNSAPIKTIWAFSENDIWVSSEGYPLHYNGNEWKLYRLHDLGVDASAEYSIWGTSSDNMYFGGGRGDLVHYDGDTFTKIELPTENYVTDIWGVEDEIYCTITTEEYGSDYKIFKIRPDGDVREALDYQLNAEVHSIWFDGNSPIYIAGAGVFKKTESGWEEIELPSKYYYRIRGNHAKDIFAVGGHTTIVHYNGVSWKTYTELPWLSRFDGLSFKGNVVATTNWFNHVIIGKRNDKK